MEKLKQYFELQKFMNYEEAKVDFFRKHDSVRAEQLEYGFNKLQKKRENLLEELAQIDEGAEIVREKFIELFSNYIKELNSFNDKPYFPDLNQRYITEKFLLSDIVSNLQFIMKFKGSSVRPQLLPSEKKWNTEPLINFLERNINDLTSSRFSSLQDVVESYIKLEKELFEEVWPATDFIEDEVG